MRFNCIFQRKLKIFRGSNIFQGEGVQLLIPIETHGYNFMEAGSGPSVPPLDPRKLATVWTRPEVEHDCGR